MASPYAYNKKRSDLAARVRMIEEANADLFLSVHLNAEINGGWQGAQVFYDDINSENKKIAECIQQVFKKRLYSKRKITEINKLYLFRKVKVPGVLLEVGFISNAHDLYLLKKESYQKKIANVITEGVIAYYESKESI